MSNEFPFSEQYRLAGEAWADKEAAAQLLEDTKSAILAQWVADLGDIPVNRAENIIKAEDRWTELIEDIVKARKAANLAKVHLKVAEMRYYENQAKQANTRTELRALGD